MLWKEIKSWCKDKGYKADRTKVVGTDNQYDYTWIKIDDVSMSGTATSVSKLACAVFNHLSEDKYLEYQTEYQNQMEKTDIEHETGF